MITCRICGRPIGADPEQDICATCAAIEPAATIVDIPVDTPDGPVDLIRLEDGTWTVTRVTPAS